MKNFKLFFFLIGALVGISVTAWANSPPVTKTGESTVSKNNDFRAITSNQPDGAQVLGLEAVCFIENQKFKAITVSITKETAKTPTNLTAKTGLQIFDLPPNLQLERKGFNGNVANQIRAQPPQS